MTFNFTKKQKLIIFLVFAVVWVGIISTYRSCDKAFIEANEIYTTYLQTLTHNGKTYISGVESSYVLEMNLDEKTYTSEGWSNETLNDLFKDKEKNYYHYSPFSERYGMDVPEGYDNVISHIEDCNLDTKRSVIDSVGYVDNGILTGFIRVYKKGGFRVLPPDFIDHSLIFTYNPENDEFTVCHTLDDVVIAGFYKDDVIYWKNKKFYKYNLKSGEEVFLTKDEGYDSGSTQWSSSYTYYNSEICIISMYKNTYAENEEYMYVYEWEKGTFTRLTEKAKAYEINLEKL